MLFRRWRSRPIIGIGTSIKHAILKRILVLVIVYILTIILTALLGPAGAAISQFIQNQL